MKMLNIALIFCLAIFIANSNGQSCGKPQFEMRRNPPHQRVVGGIEARQHSHPWIVSIQIDGSHKCGGSIIRVGNKEESDIILTAAHCISTKYLGKFMNPASTIKDFEIYAGTHNWAKLIELSRQKVKVEKLVPHPDFKFDKDDNLSDDIAIIKVVKPIKFTDKIQPVCLRTEGEAVADAELGIVAGWGRLQEDAEEASKILMQVTLPVINIDKCKKMLSKSKPPIPVSSKTMICAGYQKGGNDSCAGDSGGPFVFDKNGANVLHGIVSFGDGCARPGLYTRVSNYIKWIRDQVKALSTVAQMLKFMSYE